ncbi:autotransporter-associated beta strand repeat-containing protein, partial [Nocardioides sp. NPDC004968]|uniref:autotransporter-associated beta strand repeat-containing protein n=1 Tax=Nocardioides sp. NPDC004968 TaxID=3155894 RepID=UPI0033BD532F
MTGAVTEPIIDTIAPNPTVIPTPGAVARTLRIGQFVNGIGQLDIRSGGTLNVLGVAELGNAPGSQGTVIVSGTFANFLAVVGAGAGGTGTMTVRDGGTVNSNFGAVLGFVPDAIGTVTVTGLSSTWNVGPGGFLIGGLGTGTLTIADSGIVASGQPVSIALAAGSTGTLNIGADPLVSTAAAAPGTLEAAGVVFGDGTGTINFNHTSPNYGFAPAISGPGTVNVLAGTTLLTADNTYTGGTTINGGTLSVAADNNLGAASGGLTFNGGILQVTGTAFNSTARTITWGANGGGFDIADAANSFTVAQNLTAGGPLAKYGTGTLTLTGTNTYTGGTTISAGTLQLGNGGETGSIVGDVTN